MKSMMKWMSGVAAIVLMTGVASAADTVAAGKVKSVNADKKEFVLTDVAGKDWTIKLADDVAINRGGKESPSDLKDGDTVNVAYHKGVLVWTAHYILVKEGDTKNCELARVTVKNYDADKKEFTYTDEGGKDRTFATGSAKVRGEQDRGCPDRGHGPGHPGAGWRQGDPEERDGRAQEVTPPCLSHFRSVDRA